VDLTSPAQLIFFRG